MPRNNSPIGWKLNVAKNLFDTDTRSCIILVSPPPPPPPLFLIPRKLLLFRVKMAVLNIIKEYYRY